jgi:zinc/manganese transport system permease protein
MFNLLQYDFVQNAFLAGSLVAIMAAVTGYFVVLRAQAFAGEALADIGFAGATGAAILGIGSLLGRPGSAGSARDGRVGRACART